MRRFLERFAGTIEEEVEGLGDTAAMAMAVVEGEEEGAEGEAAAAAAAAAVREEVEVDWGTRWEMVCSPMERRKWK